ncbi:MAG: iron-sulfur cluster repair di-iron protein [Candidatus Hydrogenedentes bacterium]|nr:iron-sulfur cluster repair di-iron protein [Candidatus Hydrogenedentota bacterium]
MATISLEKTIGQLVTERPSRSRVFEKLGIDYCCGGKKTIAEVCEKKMLDPGMLLEALDAEAATDADSAFDYGSMSLSELADHIEATHHSYLRAELPRLSRMAQRVAKVHGDNDQRLQGVSDTFDAFAAELESHMAKEENVLFPGIRQIDGATKMPNLPFGSVANPIHCMEQEHDGAGSALERMRELTDGFTPPDWACNTYRALLDGLHDLELNMHQHVHKENNVLFPRAIEREKELQGA